MTAPRSRTVDDFIDGQRSGPLQIVVAAICGGVAFCDSYAIQVVNYAAPSLRDLLGLSAGQLGLVFSIGLLGMMLGGFVVGPLSDRWGRRNPMIICTLLFGALTAVTAGVTTFWQLAVLRLLAGVALGAALPNAYVLAAEFSPVRNRRLTIALLMVGYTGGGLFAGLLAAPLIAHYSWRAVFIVGAAAAGLTTILAALLVPESLVILHRRPSQHAQLRRLIRRLAPKDSLDIDLLASAPSARGGSVRLLFGPKYRTITATLWALAFVVMLSVYLYLSWTPIILHQTGASIPDAVLITAMFNLGTIVSAVSAGWLMDRFNPARVLVVFLLFGAAALTAMALAPRNPSLMKIISCAIGLGLGGALGGMNLLASTLYPAEGRVTGAGWAISVGRLGSVLGPALGAVWLGAFGVSTHVYLGLTPLLLAVAAVSLWLGGDLGGEPPGV